MSNYLLTHLADSSVSRGLAELTDRDRATTAQLLAYYAEFEARRLYLPAAHSNMFSYCVHVLRVSEETAARRIRVARAARKFPAIFAMIADGRLHFTGLALLANHLNSANVEELLDAAANRSRREIEKLLAERFPQADVPTRIVPIGGLTTLSCGSSPLDQAAAGETALAPPSNTTEPSFGDPKGICDDAGSLSPVTVAPSAFVITASTPPRVTPLAAERYALQVTIDRRTREKLEYAQSLLAHQVPFRDVAQVLDRALDALIEELEKAKFAATSKPRTTKGRDSTNPRYVPAAVKRAVWRRDNGRCTFVSDTGERCPERARLEYDHVDPVARGGGPATTGTIRLRCRAHNQYAAECAFGAGFMERKREQARVERSARAAPH